MEFPRDSVTRSRPYIVNRRPSGNISVREVFCFPVSANQFSTMQASQPAETQGQEQEDVGLVDPRTTRHLRRAAQRTDDRGSLADVQSSATVPTLSNTQGILYSGNDVNPIVFGEGSQFFVHNSFSASSSEILTLQTGEPVHYLLGTSAVGHDALYDENVKMWLVQQNLVTKGLAMRGRIGRRGDRAIRPLVVHLHVRNL